MLKNIAIIDYSIGNYSSIKNAVKNLNCKIKVTKNYSDLQNADALILPGVGTYPEAIKSLKKSNLFDKLKRLIITGKPTLGICLGMHLLTESSDEIERTKGLSIISGKTKLKLSKKTHIGWNTVSIKDKSSILYPFNNEIFYFQHNYSYQGLDKYKTGVSKAQKNITSIIKKDKIIGVQFHPEKSQNIGIKFLQTFIDQI